MTLVKKDIVPIKLSNCMPNKYLKAILTEYKNKTCTHNGIIEYFPK